MGETGDPEDCGVGIRAVALAVDGIVWFGLFFVAVYPIAFITGDVQTGAQGVSADLRGSAGLAGFVLWLALSLGYHTVAEWKTGQTLGKNLVKIEVASADGTAVTVRQSALRNLGRLVDVLPGIYAIGIALVLASDRHQRLGDRLGETVVVRS